MRNLKAAENIAAGVCVSVGTDGQAYTTTATEVSMSRLVAFAGRAVVPGRFSNFRSPGENADASNLTAGSEYFAGTGGVPTLFSALSAGAWTRSIGTALASDKLAFSLGPVQQKAA